MNRLDKLPIGAIARVVEVEGSDELAMRLMEMGLTPGVELSVLGVAPLGDPLELLLRGYRLSVRKTEASRIAVEPVVR
jgi:ferrous iron transport protein A